MTTYEAESREHIFVPHGFAEQRVDLGEVRMNYAVTGDASRPPLLLIPGQTESWWGYEAAMPRLAERFHVHAVDVRGQGRSTWTPGRYTLDNMGNDLVRFVDLVIGRPTVVAGLSSGGVLAAWLSAYAKPGQVLAACYEDPPLFASQTAPAFGQSIMQSAGPVFALFNKWLGDQWSIGNWDGLRGAAQSELPAWLAAIFQFPESPPQSLLEYDPEWGRAFSSGSVAAGCDHAQMLAAVRVPVLLTHHFHVEDPATGHLMGAMSDVQAAKVREAVEANGQPFEYRVFPQMGHAMHEIDPDLYADTLIDWASGLGLA